jgi:hypothetical protein
MIKLTVQEKTVMQNQRPPVAPDQQVGIQDDTQAQILRELKRQNALLEEQLRPQREADARKKAADARNEAEKLALRRQRISRLNHYNMIEQLAPIVSNYEQKCQSINRITSQPAPYPPLTYGGSMDWSVSDKQAIYDHHKKQQEVPKLLAEEKISFDTKIEEILSKCLSSTADYYRKYISENRSMDVVKIGYDKKTITRLLDTDAPRHFNER